MDYLDISNVRELEDLIIEAIYQDVIKGKLDQKKKQLEIEYTMGRDVRPERISQMLDVLGAWSVVTNQNLFTLLGHWRSVKRTCLFILHTAGRRHPSRF